MLGTGILPAWSDCAQSPADTQQTLPAFSLEILLACTAQNRSGHEEMLKSGFFPTIIYGLRVGGSHESAGVAGRGTEGAPLSMWRWARERPQLRAALEPTHCIQVP